MGVDNAKGGWVKKGSRFGFSYDLDGGSDNPTIELRDSTIQVWPTPDQSVSSFDVRAGGTPLKKASDYIIGRPKPSFTVTTPFSKQAFAIFLLALMQKASYASSKYTINQYTQSNVQPGSSVSPSGEGGFLVVESGYAGGSGAGAVWRATGVVGSSLAVTIPSSGDDGGKPTLSCSFIGANSVPQDTFGGSPSVSTDGISPSTKFAFNILASSGSGFSITGAKVVDYSLTLNTSPALSPNIGETSDGVFIGELTGTGSVSVLLDVVSAGQFDNLYTAHRGSSGQPTPVRLQLENSALQSDDLIDLDAVLMSPTFTQQGNAVVASFGFEVAEYTTSRPQFVVETADLSFPNQ